MLKVMRMSVRFLRAVAGPEVEEEARTRRKVAVGWWDVVSRTVIMTVVRNEGRGAVVGVVTLR